MCYVYCAYERHHLGRRGALIEQATDLQRGLQAEGNFGLHVGKLVLIARGHDR